MSAQEFADVVSNLDLEPKSTTQGTSLNNTENDQPKGRTRSSATKGKKSEMLVGSNDDEGGDKAENKETRSKKEKGKKNNQGDRVEILDGGEENMNRQVVRDEEREGRVGEKGNERDDRGRGDDRPDDEIGVLSGRGRIFENMPEPTAIEITHKKWLNNIKRAAPTNVPLYKLLKEEYEVWCTENNTKIRSVNLFDLDLEEIPTPPIGKVVEKTKDTSCSKIESNTLMMDGEDVGHTMTSLSEYFKNLMIHKTIHVPVSIFDPKWLMEDASYMRSKKPKATSCASDALIYNGWPVVNEFWLSFAEWTVRYDLMVKYQALIFDVLDSQKKSPIAPKLLTHKENVLQIKIDCDGKWTPAMRYDVAHRRNVWENRLANGAMADVGKLNVKLAEHCEKDAKNYGDYNYVDNPFVLGGPMQNINPLDGMFNIAWDTSGSSIANHADLMTGRSVVVWGNQSVNPFQHIAPIQVGNYTGRNFDANYHQNRNNRHQPYKPIPYNQSSYPNNHQPFYNSSNRGPFASGHRGRGRGTGRGGRGRPAIGPGSYQPLAIEQTPTEAPEVMTPGRSMSS
ncbi:hypothetical protein DFH28DRAFT_1075340 [Melampsora americana]|nr:hypothetical protein DFH28DRAFT_1075340 [Melampsora americana]